MSSATTVPEQPGSGPKPAALEVTGLSHRFGTRKALEEVSLTLRPGDFTVLLGQNGAGKTTLFSLATRLYSNQGGSIRVFGRELDRHPSEALSRIGAVFQQRTLDLDLTVAQNLLYHAALHGMPRRLARERMVAELARIGLAERAGDKVRQLSGGQLRRVEIARALVHRPRLLLCDEATVGLDIESRRGILEHVRRLVQEDELAVLWATHLIDEVVPGNRVVILHRGRVLAEGELEELLRDSGQPDIGALFTALTRADPPGRSAR